MKKLMHPAVIVGLVVLGLVSTWVALFYSEYAVQRTAHDPVTFIEYRMCGTTMRAAPLKVGNVDIGQTMATLLTREYETTQFKEGSFCYWMLRNGESGRIIGLSFREDLSNYELGGKPAYIIVVDRNTFVVDKETREIWNTNEMDGSLGSVMGKFEQI